MAWYYSGVFLTCFWFKHRTQPVTVSIGFPLLFVVLLRLGGRPKQYMVKLKEITLIHAPVERCFDLARSVEVHLEGNIHWSEQALATGGITSGLLGLDQRVRWRARHFGLWHALTSEITEMQPPAYFQDKMIDGPFRSLIHNHKFQTLPNGVTSMKDTLIFAAPVPLLGRVAEITFLKRYMQTLLRERNAAIKRIAESNDWLRFLPS